jgi:hypothetical protein
MPCLEFNDRVGRRARIWFDALPNGALLPKDAAREMHVYDARGAVARWKRVAIEVFRPFAASFHYGLLGGEYRSIDRNKFEIVVPVGTPNPARRYDDALAGSLDTVIVGSRPEYASAICLGAEQVNIGVRPQGILDITCMTHGEIGSAPIIFSALARALMIALCRPDQPSSLEEAMALLA